MGKIRFPLMEEGYLRSRVVGMAPAEDVEWMEGVVAEALRAKAARGDGAVFEFELLGPKAVDDRVGLGVKWEKYADGGGRRLTGHTADVWAVVECDTADVWAVVECAEYEGRVCSGSLDGSIKMWKTTGPGEATDEQPGLRHANGDRDPVYSLSAWEDRLVSGHCSGKLRVWNVVTGACDQVLEGHTLPVLSLVVCGLRLASGSADKSIRVWAIEAGAAGPRTCEWTLLGHACCVWSLAGWRGKVLSGSEDKSIRVWDVETGAHDATLVGHDGGVMGLAVHGDRLFSASDDGTIRAWALRKWVALQTVEMYGRWTKQYPWCLAVCGSRLISGSRASGEQGELLVWGLATLDLQHTLPQPAGADVRALLAVEGGVWAGVGRDVVVWAREA